MNNFKKKIKKWHWLIALCITTIVAMYVYGMTAVYLPDPIDIGFGQYLDIGTGIAVFCLTLSVVIVGILFSNKKKNN